eukprot:2244668-Prymnesium_polylepis.1
MPLLCAAALCDHYPAPPFHNHFHAFRRPHYAITPISRRRCGARRAPSRARPATSAPPTSRLDGAPRSPSSR